MSRDLFTSVDPVTTSSKQWYTVPLSILAHVIALLVFVVVPLVANNVLPTPESVMVFAVPPPPPAAPATPAPPPRAEVPAPPTPVFANRDAAPAVAPREITPAPPRALLVAPRGIDEGMLRGPSVMLAPPPPGRGDPVPVGGDIQPPRKLKDAAPIYPTVARAAKIDGIVIVEATIAKDGSVRNARVLRGKPLLDQAALDAVNQWKFSPTLLNGEAVEVIMSVTVNFTLR